MPRNYIIANIRKLMDLGFNAADLRRLCQESNEFKPVFNNLGSGMSKADIIEAIIDHAEKYLVMDPLLEWLEKNNPRQYALNGPYYEDLPSSPSPGTAPVLPPGPSKPRRGSRPWVVILAVGAALLVIGVILFTNLVDPIEPTPEPTLALAPTPLPPQFEITALDTLEGDKNAYEVTDMLIWNQKNLEPHGMAITFPLEIKPVYSGSGHFGKVIALISNNGNPPYLEKPLWDDFTTSSETRQIQLSLPELLKYSALKQNSDPPINRFHPGDISFQEAKLTVQVAWEGDKEHPWSQQEIVVRNAPWETKAELVRRQDRYEVDVYVKNLGGTGEFTVRYYLALLDKEIDPGEALTNSGAAKINTGNEPVPFAKLQPGEFFTHTIALPLFNDLAPGHYLVDVYAVKKQNYILFTNPETTWENLDSLEIPGWFGPSPTLKLPFLKPRPEFQVNEIVQTELDRLLDEEGKSLGFATAADGEVTSKAGTTGWRQEFSWGEVYLYNNRAYALYGPILEHYKALGGVQSDEIGFPASPIQTINSSSGITGTMMEFEGNYALQYPAVIYASKKGVAGTWGLIGLEHVRQGGCTGWLGLPLADEQYFQDSTIQMFEYGYIVYYHPLVDEEPDWGRPLEVVPYLASRGQLFDVDAGQFWQDTGVEVQAGDRVTIVQVGGTWTYREGIALFDANGTSILPLQTNAIIPSALVGTLVGRVGEGSDHVFPVGRWKVFQAPAEGLLYLTMNDNGYDDNAGFITMQIMVENSD